MISSRYAIYFIFHFMFRPQKIHSPLVSIDQKQASTLSASGSSYGGFSLDLSPNSCFTIDICSDLLLGAVAAGAAVGLVLLYQAITTKGKRKRKRSPVTERLSIWFLWGMCF